MRPSKPKANRVGRPRVNQDIAATDPREDLLEAAAKLFIDVGFTRATTKEIARLAGLQQPSLFHYFPTKDSIFAELIERVVKRGLEILRGVEAHDAPASVKLYALTRDDTLNICSGPTNVGRLTMLPEARLPQFKRYWSRNTELLEGYRHLVDGGRAEGAFDVANPELATRIAYGTVESVVLWFDRDGDRTAIETADAVAATVLRGLLREPEDLPEIAATAAAIIAATPADQS